MTKRSMLWAVSIAAMLGFAAIAMAATFQVEPSVVDEGTTLRVSGTVSGLAASDVVVRVRATADARVTCINPGDQEPAGQNREKMRRITVNGSQTIAASQLTNGVATLDVRTLSPELTAKQAGCPNARWTARVDEVTFKSVNIRVLQNGQLVLARTMRL
jgi:hypothetical protein